MNRLFNDSEYKRVRENAIADAVVSNAALHRHLQYGHDLAAFRAQNRRTQYLFGFWHQQPPS